MGGRLRLFPEAWKTLGSRFGYSVATQGLRLGFQRYPPANKKPKEAPAKHQALLTQAVEELLQKDAIERVEDSQVLHYSPFFGIRQVEKFRPILDARQLNSCLAPPHFKLEGLEAIASMLRPGDWLSKVDIKDAYLHVPLAYKDRPYTGFGFAGQTYRFKVLPFGVSSAPYLFTKITRLVISQARSEGMRITSYLDDICLASSSEAEGIAQSQRLAEILESAGWIINLKKSTIGRPSQSQEFLGMIVDAGSMRFRLSQTKVHQMRSSAKGLLKKPRTDARTLASVVGFLQSTRLAVRPAMMMLRHLLADLNAATRRTSRPWSSIHLQLSPGAREELVWWATDAAKFSSAPLVTLAPTVSICTDASGTGWGCSSTTMSASGFWSPEEAMQSINWKELTAIALSLEAAGSSLSGQVVLIRTDNTTALWNVRRQGHSSHSALVGVARRIWRWAMDHDVHLLIEHIRGVDNVDADRLSRQSRDEYGVSPAWFRWLDGQWGPHTLDLFGSRLSHVCSPYVSLLDDGTCLYSDAFARKFPSRGAWAHPRSDRQGVTALPTRRGRVHDSNNPRLAFSVSPILRETSSRLPEAPAGGDLGSSTASTLGPAVRPDGLATFEATLTAQGVPPEVVSVIVRSRRGSTWNSYRGAWRQYYAFCQPLALDPRDPVSLSSFLVAAHRAGKSLATLRSYVFGCSVCLSRFDGSDSLATSAIVSDTLRGLEQLVPVRLPKRHTWDVAHVLRFYANFPGSTLQEIAERTALLLALATGWRPRSDLSRISWPDCCCTQAGILLVALRPKEGPFKEVFLPRLEEVDASTCAVRAIEAYLLASLQRRDDETRSLFLTVAGPVRAASADTLGRWVSSALRRAGVMDSAHSTRAASTSHALATGLSLDRVLASANWSLASTFARHYRRPLVTGKSIAVALVGDKHC